MERLTSRVDGSHQWSADPDLRQCVEELLGHDVRGIGPLEMERVLSRPGRVASRIGVDGT
jgi:hypothetical protein